MSEGKRVKRWAPKVFSGCQTCKRRRIKCDETKPKCQRCTRSSIPCEGYVPPATRMFDPSKKASDSSQSSEQSKPTTAISTPPTRATPSPNTAVLAFTAPDEQQAFEFFTNKTANLISIYSHKPFWTKVLPRAAQQHAPVKHSILALSVLHQSLAKDGCLSEDNSERMFDYYSKAIRALTTGQPPIEVVLMTSLLFWTIEAFNDRGGKAYNHVEAAMRILDEFKSKESNKSNPEWELITQHIEPVVRNTHIHKTLNNVQAMPGFDKGRSDKYSIMSDGLPMGFSTLKDATAHLHQCLRLLLKITNDRLMDHAQWISEINLLETHLCRWLALYHTLTVAADSLSRRMLVVHHVTAMVLCITLKERWQLAQPDAAKSKSRALWITHEIEDLTNVSLTATGGGGSLTTVSYELGMIPPLFVVAVLSQDLPLKAQALVLLKKMDVVEGAWKSGAAAVTAETIVQMQEVHGCDGRLTNIAFGNDDDDLTLYRVDTDTKVQCPIWGLLKGFDEVDLDVLTKIVHDYGYQLDGAA